MDNRHIVIFDGLCNLCNGAVNFIIKRDPNAIFVFTPIQSDLADKLMRDHQIISAEIDTFLLIKNGKAHIRTDAALEITKDLSGLWFLFRVFRIIPPSLRDILYRLIAKNRYKLLGKRDECMIPTQELRERFIGVST